MKRAVYIALGALYGAILGYFFLFFLVHFASLYMESDDDLNQAVCIGLIVWPVLIILAGSLGNELYTRIAGKKKLSKLKWFSFILLGATTGIVVADLVLDISNKIISWRFYTTGGEENIIFLSAWAIFSFAGCIVTIGLIIKYLTKGSSRRS